ncbi:uncharacterized protein TNCV_1433661 [Trichonephila clavipes]|nr:uncharacterized protein TNCV_1433661 [Trichonephila clavipes]
MNKECRFCGALKWKEEAASMCCSGGKVALPSIDEPVEPLKELFSYETDKTRRFLKNITEPEGLGSMPDATKYLSSTHGVRAR